MKTIGEIGALRRRVAIQEMTLVPDGAGGFESGWTTIAQTWAAFSPISAAESYDEGLVTSRTTHKVLIRYREDIHPSMRIVAGTRSYEVLASLDPDDRRSRLQLYVEEART
ncbi:MAG: phage head closure protein [Pseudomonadota bacterium]